MEVYTFGALVVVTLTLFLYTHLVMQRLRHEFRVTGQAYAAITTMLASDLADPAMDDVIIQLAREIGRTMKFPSIVTDAEGVPQAWSRDYEKYLGADEAANVATMKKFAAELDRRNEPLLIVRYARDRETGIFRGTTFGHFHYGEPRVLSLLYFVPALELILIAAFLGAAVVSYRRLKTVETQALWAGMARETAHQLGTPITSLMGWVEILRERAAADPLLAEPLREINEDIQRLEKIAARFQEIGMPVKLAVGDVIPLITKAVDYGRRRVPGNASISIEVITPESLYVGHSPILVEWVVENLIKNAVDATKHLPSGKGRIVVEARREKAAAVITVRDNGVGIAAHELDLIFTPGYSTKEKGWGLGLSLVKRIVEDVHRGRLAVTSTPGAGSAFEVFLPLTVRGNK